MVTENKIMDGAIHVSPCVTCVHCNAMVPIPDRIVAKYFQGVQTPCPNCEKLLDWWDTILETIRTNFMLVQALMPIGAQWTLFTITLRPDCHTKLKFADHGIPSDARILHVNYTPVGGGLFPVETDWSVQRRHLIAPVINLYPVPFPVPPPGVEPRTETQINVMVTWISHTTDDEAWQNLTDAFEAYALSRYEAAIIPANTAVESTIRRVLGAFLERIVSRKRVRSFLQDGATYSHQLNVLLPALLSLTDAPHLPDHIRGALNRLRDLRNQLAHSGVLETPLEQDDAAKCLCAALFGFHYLNLIRPVLLTQLAP